MRKLISFMHISLDGFVAGPNGEMNWITINEEIFDFVGKKISAGDTAMYGRKTFEMMEGYWPTAAEKENATKHDIDHSKWYKGIRKIVLSNSLKQENLSKTIVLGSDFKGALQKIKEEEGPDILVFGSPSATHALLAENLIDGFWLFQNPIVLGNGVPLFKNIEGQKKLKLESTHVFDCGVVELLYKTME